MEPPGQYRVSRLNAWGFAVLDRLTDANILIAAAGEPSLRRYMPHIALPVIANSVVVQDMVQTSAVHHPPVVLFIGEILERKGPMTLLDALDLPGERGLTGLDVQIVGENHPGLDPDKDRMVVAVAEHGRAGDMTGPLERAEVYRQLSESDL